MHGLIGLIKPFHPTTAIVILVKVLAQEMAMVIMEDAGTTTNVRRTGAMEVSTMTTREPGHHLKHPALSPAMVIIPGVNATRTSMVPISILATTADQVMVDRVVTPPIVITAVVVPTIPAL